jgi:predicted DNA-binding protein YlxM (UPF0122 family)
MDNETLLKAMLYDFFGELLTEKQYEYYDLYHNEDFSLSEIAEKAGITRQGVHDIIMRAEKALAQMEHKTGVVQRWLDTRAGLEQAQEIAGELLGLLDEESKSAQLARKLIITLEELRN